MNQGTISVHDKPQCKANLEGATEIKLRLEVTNNIGFASEIFEKEKLRKVAEEESLKFLKLEKLYMFWATILNYSFFTNNGLKVENYSKQIQMK